MSVDKQTLDAHESASNRYAGAVAVGYVLMAAIAGIAGAIGYMIGTRIGCGA